MMKVIDILPDLYYLELTFIFSSTFLKLSNPLALKTPMSADSFFFFFPPQLVPSPSTFWVSPHFPIKRTTWTYSFTLPNTHHSALGADLVRSQVGRKKPGLWAAREEGAWLNAPQPKANTHFAVPVLCSRAAVSSIVSLGSHWPHTLTLSKKPHLKCLCPLNRA